MNRNLNHDHNRSHMEHVLIEVGEGGVICVHGEIGHADFVRRISIGITMLDEFIKASRKWAKPKAAEADVAEAIWR